MASKLYNTLAIYIGTYIRRMMHGGRYERFVILSFEDDGIRATRIRKCLSNGTNKVFSDIRIPHVTEHTLRHHKAMRTFLLFVFFPFSYRLYITTPHYMGRSYADSIHLRRVHATPLTQEELEQFFAHQLGGNVESRKKESMRKLHCEDVDVLLVEHKIIAARAGHTPIDIDTIDRTLLGTKEKEISFYVVQTFMRRNVFSALHTVLPKRARIYSILEEGFSVPVQITRMAWESAAPLHNISFITALVQNQGTDLFVLQKGSTTYYDTIPTGYRSMYETINTRLGFNQSSFDRMIYDMGHDHMSVSMRKHIQDMLVHEMDRMIHGLQAAKRETLVKGIICAPEAMRGFLEHEPRLRRTLITPEAVVRTRSTHNESEPTSVIQSAHIAYITETPVARDLNTAAIRHIRWLLPHKVEKSRE